MIPIILGAIALGTGLTGLAAGADGMDKDEPSQEDWRGCGGEMATGPEESGRRSGKNPGSR
ncbi:MAG: hypothetical protein SNJ60_03500 [Pseudanabaenaceae cyanobacterium]